ncbi:MAG: PEP-CTERM sorting domain-containing protein [Kiritimatiellae bacterium]|nr:PEP-CTERM sorting domain-containing protein [Kiritimatiellia bacterium]
MKSFAVIALAVLFVGVVSTSANIIVDNFDEGGVSVFVNNSSTTATDRDTGLSSANTIGGERYSVLLWQAGTDNTTLQVNQGGDNTGVCSFGSQPSNDGFFQLFYGDASDLNADLFDVENNRIGIHFGFSDVYGTTTVTVATSGGGASTLAVPNPTGGPMDTWMYFDYSAFSGTADFNDIDSITVTVDGIAGADITIDEISTSYIPEPTTAALLGLCGIAFFSRRWSGRKQL